MLWLGAIGLAKGVGWREYDNARPRAAAFYATGWRSRALAAHQNGFEALPFFTVAVLLAEFRSAPQRLVDGLAVTFVVMRSIYVAAYLSDKPTLRSAIWTAAFLVNAALFLTPLARG
jgi:uncharacterized MAPEG superfamily protein